MARVSKVTTHPAVLHFEARFSELGTAKRATGAKAYMKSALRFHGVDNGQVRAETRQYGPLERQAAIDAARALFATDAFDLRTAALFLLERHVKVLTVSDLPWLIELARRGACWAHVDHIATQLVDPILDREQAIAQARTWAADDDFWIRRVALLAQLRPLRQGKGDFDLFAEIAAPMLPETEFFIRKAIGWVLREVSKKRPQLVRDFLLAHGPACSGVTWREATKYLPPAMKKAVEAARATAPRVAAAGRPKARRRP